ncbi:MAG TPA: gliding motility-associated C-terminal domain-containing protein [Bacteroidales bacterium]|nr:gliding motility-associated C-terminal domain-containing protein [Bacteroidales bacterium]
MVRNWYLIILLIISDGFLFSVYSQVVVINEVCTSPASGATGSSINANSLYNMSSTEQPPENREWIELYNPHPCNSADISCYTLASNMLQPSSPDDVPNWGAFTFPSGTIIPPLGFIIVGGNNSSVPVLDFNTTYYRQTTFGVQYLDGDDNRWFLRDEYGWIALYNPAGAPVDAVYWDAYGNASNLFYQTEYSHNVITTTSCSGTQSLSAARNIAGIEYIGMCSPGTDVSFQRITDGSATWFSGPVTATARHCNGPCVTPPVLTSVVQNESCAGNDGSITINIQDGHSGPYTITWMQPAGLHTSTISNLSAGTYIVQVADAYNCFIVYDTIVITSIPDPAVTFTNIINESCGSGNGSLEAVVSNGNLPINYHWDNPGSGNTASLHNLSAGTYNVTITDSYGCTATNTVTLINFSGPELSIESVQNELCSAANGAVYTIVTGGSPPFSFIWNSSPVQNGQHLIHVHEGHYTVTITDINNCSATADTVITNVPPPVMLFSHIQADTCRKQTGAATITISGGHPPYNCLWSADSMNNNTFITHLSEGAYQVSVTDSFCTVTASFSVPLIPGPKADFTLYPPVTTIDDPVFRFTDCSTGIISNWLWNFGDNSTSTIKNPYHSYDAIGKYNITLTIFNQSGCLDSITKTAIVFDRTTLFVPNCFTPNGDGINDYFYVAGQNVTDFAIFIFNRWGGLVYHSDDLSCRWDGTFKGAVVPEDVYTWLINYSEDWGGMFSLPKSKKGTLTVVR